MSIYFCTLRSKFQVAASLKLTMLLIGTCSVLLSVESRSEVAIFNLPGINTSIELLFLEASFTFLNDLFVQQDGCYKFALLEVRNHVFL